MDKFPEAFRRFEMDAGTDGIHFFRQLEMSYEQWAGYHWKGSDKQIEALKREAEKINRRRVIFGISKIEGIRRPEPEARRAYRSRGAFERERMRRSYTVIKVRGKTRIVARIPKGKAGAGRFAKRT